MAQWEDYNSQRLVADVGAHTIKYTSSDQLPLYSIDRSYKICSDYNYVTRLKKNNSLLSHGPLYSSDIKTTTQIQRPFNRGLPIHIPLLTDLLNNNINKFLNLNQSIQDYDNNLDEFSLTVVLPNLIPIELMRELSQHIYETIGFDALCRISPNICSMLQFVQQKLINHYNYEQNTDNEINKKKLLETIKKEFINKIKTPQLVVDIGYSNTTIVPIFDMFPVNYGIRRVPVGGKILTALLKDYIKNTQYNLNNDTLLIDDIKHKSSFISSSFLQDINNIKQNNNQSLRQLLPDNSKSNNIGRLIPSTQTISEFEQVLNLDISRFKIPEVIFHPSDVGIFNMGIHEAIYNSVESLPEHLKSHMYNNIILTGGTSKIFNIQNRLSSELRKFVNSDQSINIESVDDPILSAAKGACLFSQLDIFREYTILKYDQHEFGDELIHYKMQL